MVCHHKGRAARSRCPVDAYIDPIRAALARHRAAVLTAAPGAGKTTRVPPALVDAGRVLLLQPRRVAARAMARRIADEHGWTLGAGGGLAHPVRAKRFAPRPRLLVVTEGILTAYLQDDPLLSGVATLVVDEFHERSIHADLGSRWPARRGWRATICAILVMSATLDAGAGVALSRRLPGDRGAGRTAPALDQLHARAIGGRGLEEVLPSARGDVLCFLPGAGEIARAARRGRAVAARHDVEVLPLHGSLDADAQDAALSPRLATAGHRRHQHRRNLADRARCRDRDR